MTKAQQAILEYTLQLAQNIRLTDPTAIEQALEVLYDCYQRRGTIFVFGNGGSAATANHFAADFEKNAVKNSPLKPSVISLGADATKILAYGNDIDFSEVFASQLLCLAKPDDVAIPISASGNSPNIVRAVEVAKNDIGMKVIGLSGFSGGLLKVKSNVSIHYQVDSYEMAEDLHMMVCHILVKCFGSMIETMP